MLSRIKEIVSGNEARELSAQLSEQLKQATMEVKVQTELLEAMKKESAANSAASAAMAAEIKQAVTVAKELQDEIRTDIAELKALSTHIQGSIKQKITDDMAELTKDVRAKLDGAEKLKQEVVAAAAAITAELGKLKIETTRLAAVAEKIKAEDFELTRFSGQILSADKEKLQLMSRIDALEHLIAKMRRRE